MDLLGGSVHAPRRHRIGTGSDFSILACGRCDACGRASDPSVARGEYRPDAVGRERRPSAYRHWPLWLPPRCRLFQHPIAHGTASDSDSNRGETIRRTHPTRLRREVLRSPGETIATLRIGYVDGLPCTLADGGGAALVRGMRCRIVGAIGMQFTMVHVPPGVPVALGEEMTLLHDSEGMRLDDVARMARILPHQLVTALGAATRPSSWRTRGSSSS